MSGVANGPATSTPWQRWKHSLSHHLIVALTVASAVGLLHHSSALDWLDAMMLRLTGAVVAQEGGKKPLKFEPPEILLIGSTVYEQVFEQRSPLDRAKLATLLEALFRQPGGLPSTLVLDVDVSDNGTDSGQAALDQQLERLVRGGVGLILPLPLPVTTSTLLESKVSWMRRACGWNSSEAVKNGRVVFANTELLSHAGRVLQYSTRDLTLGMAATRPKGAEDVCMHEARVQKMLVHASTPPERRKLVASTRHFPKTRPFNAEFFHGLTDHVHELQSTTPPSVRADGVPLSFEGRVVFLGGSYDSRDRFESALEEDGQPTEGVTLHAAVFYSASHPVTVEQGIGALIADILFGVAAGFMFSWAWQRHDAVRAAGGWRGYVAPKLIFLGTLLFAVLLAVSLVWLAARFFYPLNLWVSPGPVVLGVCAKLMLSRHGHTENVPHVSQWLNRAGVGALALGNLAVILMHA